MKIVSKNSDDISNPRLYWGSIIAFAALVLILSIIGVLMSLSGNIFGYGLIFAAVVWLGLSIRVLELEDIGGVTLFGIALKNVSSGPTLVPNGLQRLRLYKRTVQQRQFPGDKEEIFGGDDKDPLPPGMVRPLRIMTGEPEDVNSVLDIQMAVELQYYLRIQISDPLKFALQFGDLEEFWRQIRDTGDRVLTRKISQIPGVGVLIQEISNLMEDMTKKFEEIAKKGGVTIVETGLNSPDITHSLSKAVRDIGITRAQATATKVAAEAEKVRLTEEGEGRAAAEAILIEKISEKLETAGEAAQAVYIGERGLGDKTTILGTEGLAQAFGLGKTLVLERS